MGEITPRFWWRLCQVPLLSRLPKPLLNGITSLAVTSALSAGGKESIWLTVNRISWKQVSGTMTSCIGYRGLCSSLWSRLLETRQKRMVLPSMHSHLRLIIKWMIASVMLRVLYRPLRVFLVQFTPCALSTKKRPKNWKRPDVYSIASHTIHRVRGIFWRYL